MSNNLAVVIVTYNRCELLQQSLTALEKQSYPIDSVIVVNNASTDGITQAFLDNYTGSLPLQVIHNPTNTGGAGGFHTGIKTAHEQGYEWVFVIDDDVVAHPDCLKNLMAVKHPCMMVVREDTQGNLVERSVVSYDFVNPFKLNPKGKMICEMYQSREQMPATVEVSSGAFEGFMMQKQVINSTGYPDPRFFILYDDLDFILRARQAGFTTVAVRDAILIRQLPFNIQDTITSWKSFYAFRNLFYIHYKFGKNWVVRHKPYVLAFGAMIVYGMKHRKRQVIKDIYQALKHHKNLTPQDK